MKVGAKYRSLSNDRYIFEDGSAEEIKRGDIIECVRRADKTFYYRWNNKEFSVDFNYESVEKIFREYFEEIRPTNRVKLLRNPGCYNAQDTYRLAKVGEIINFVEETATEYIYREYDNVPNWIDKRDCEPIYKGELETSSNGEHH